LVGAVDLIWADRHYNQHGATDSPPTYPPPRLIGREAAAAYIYVSPTTFDEMVDDGRMPPARILGGRRRAWDVRELDEAVDRLPRDQEQSDASWEDVDAT
jgi:predicted DNA-binding transcriptional regulator AlpA